MANVVTTATTLSKVVPIYYDKVFFERLEKNRVLVFRQFGDKKPLPKREGSTIYWHSWRALTKGRLITESGAGQAQGISARRVSASLIMIGDHAKVTAYVDMVAINSVVQAAIELFADAAAWSMDFMCGRQLLWKKTAVSAMLESTSNSGSLGNANYLSAAGTASALQFQAPVWIIDWLTSRNHALSAMNGGVSATLLTPKIFRWAKLKLKVKMTRPFQSGNYKCVLHPDLLEQLRGSSAYIDLHKYSESGHKVFDTGSIAGGKGPAPENGLEGYIEGFDIYSSTEAPMCAVTNAQPSSHGAGRYYFSLFFGQGAYGVTDFDGGVQTFVKTPGPQDTSQPLNLFSTVGYRAIATHAVLNPSACLWIATGKPTEVG